MAESDWPPEGDDGYEQAFFDLSLAFPHVALSVFGWGTDPLDAWQTSFAPNDVQFATASVETPRHVVRTGEHPKCPACGYSGDHILYFEPRIFRASLQPDLSIKHHGLVLQPHLGTWGMAFLPASVVTAACIGLSSSSPL